MTVNKTVNLVLCLSYIKCINLSTVLKTLADADWLQKQWRVASDVESCVNRQTQATATPPELPPPTCPLNRFCSCSVHY